VGQYSRARLASANDARRGSQASKQDTVVFRCRQPVDRKSLLLAGTALVSALWVSAPPSAQAGPDPCTFPVPGTALCQGNQSDGIASGADFPTPPGPPDITVLNVNSLNAPGIATSGNNVSGISFLSPGAITINSDTEPFRITTQGDKAYGIFAYSTGGGLVTVTQTGGIATRGHRADGISALSFGGAVTVTQTGDISTIGEYAFGIDAYGGAVTVTQTGDISTRGYDARGIFAGSSGGGAATVTQTGDVSTQGDFAHGIRADGGGAATVTQTGNITTQGDFAYGISAYTPGGGAATVTQTGNIATEGYRARGTAAARSR